MEWTSARENSISVLVGPQETITSQLNEAGVEHEVVDWKQRGYDMHAAADPKSAAKAAKDRAKAEKKANKKKAR